MKRIVFVVLFAALIGILPIGSNAQVPSFSANIPVTLWGGSFFDRQTFSYGQFTKNTDIARWEVGTSVRLPRGCLLKYAAVSGFETNESLILSSPLTIGETSFGDDEETIDLGIRNDWEHRFTVIGPFNWVLNPAVVLQTMGITITGRNDQKGDSASYNELFWGVGAAYRQFSGPLLTEVLGVGSNNFWRVEASVSYRPWRDLALNLAYTYDSRALNENFRIMNRGLYVGGTVDF